MVVEPQYTWLGQGWNTFEGKTTNQVVDFEHKILTDSNEYNVFVCESAQEISEHLGVSGSLNVESPFVDVEAKAEFVRDLTKKTNSVTIIARAKQTYSAEISSVRFQDKLKDSDKNVQKILKYAGDSYINYVQTGVEYYAVFQFSAYSQEQKDKISASISASGGGITSVNASLSSQLDEVAKNSGSSYTFFQHLNGDALELPDSKTVTDFARKIVNHKNPHPKLLYCKTVSYAKLLDAPDGFDKIDDWIRAYNNPKWYPLSLRSIERQAHFARDRIRAARLLYSFYNGDSMAKEIDRKDKGCGDTIKAIKEWKDAFTHAPDDLKQPTIDIECLKIPAPRFNIIEGKLWGRQQGGNSWTDVDEYSVYAFVYPKSWKGRGQQTLDQITTVYAHRDPSNPHDETKEVTIATQHGGDGGSSLAIAHTFAPNAIHNFGAWSYRGDSPLKDIIVGVEFYQDQISYVLGRNNGEYHGQDKPVNSFFLGFAGRSYQMVDAIQPLWVKFEEPEWTSLAEE